VLKLGVDKLKVAVVGFGKMGILHAGILNALPKVQLVAVCEKSGLIRRFMRKLFRDVLWLTMWASFPILVWMLFM